MRLLVDTHLLLWAALEPEKLSQRAYDSMALPDAELWFSAVSVWEASIKYAQNRPDFNIHPQVLRRGLLRQGYRELVITSEHGLVAGALPLIHKDPFDRLLVAQAQVEGLTLLTADELVAKYPGPIRLV